MAPRLEKAGRHLELKFSAHGPTIAKTDSAYLIFEGSSPAYYFPREAVLVPLEKTKLHTTCPWKGEASYWTISNPDRPDEQRVNRIWSYEHPKPAFEAIKGYISCYSEFVVVDGEEKEL